MKNPNLLKRTKFFKNIIFDLDNTLISLSKYDFLLYKKICELIEKNQKKRKDILNKLILLRKRELKIGKKIDIFHKVFLDDRRSVKAYNIYNNYFPGEFKIKKNIYLLLERLKFNKKKIYLVSNGDKKRQLNKIQKLKIKKFFTKIFILDGKKKKFKPSVESVKNLRRIIEGKTTVMIGDSKIDKKFAKNLKVQYIKFVTI